MRARINFEAVIEMFVCGADVWQDGGPSLSGKPEQEEQTPRLEGAKSEANKHYNPAKYQRHRLTCPVPYQD